MKKLMSLLLSILLVTSICCVASSSVTANAYGQAVIHISDFSGATYQRNQTTQRQLAGSNIERDDRTFNVGDLVNITVSYQSSSQKNISGFLGHTFINQTTNSVSSSKAFAEYTANSNEVMRLTDAFCSRVVDESGQRIYEDNQYIIGHDSEGLFGSVPDTVSETGIDGKTNDPSIDKISYNKICYNNSGIDISKNTAVVTFTVQITNPGETYLYTVLEDVTETSDNLDSVAEMVNVTTSLKKVGNVNDKNVKVVNDFAYEVVSGKVSITNYCGNSDKVVIPSKIAGKTVTTLSDESFSYGEFSEITVPESISYIGTSAFEECSNLKKVNYKGSQSQWNKIEKESGNTSLTNAKLYCSKVDTLTLNETDITMNVGDTTTLTATLSPKDTTVTYTWSTSNSKVATVNTNGTITAKSGGNAVITVKSSNNLTATCNVTVISSDIAVISVKLNKTALTIKKGNSEKLTATITPSDATDKTITWTSSNTSVATVSGGTVKALKKGTATITAKTSNGKTATCDVTVVEEIDESAPQIIVESKTTNPSSKVDIAVSLKNNPGIVGMTLGVRFDESVLKLVDVKDSELLGTNSHKPEYETPYTLSWSNDTATTNFNANGTIAVLTFEVDKNAAEGEYPITISYDYDNMDIYNKDLDSVNFETVNGIVTVADYICGDVNNDGKVNNMDRVYLTRYLAKWNQFQNINLKAADVNLDGKVNNMDKVILTRHLAKWNDYAEIPYTK